MAQQSLVIDLIRTPDFMDNYNLDGCFKVAQMDGTTKNYEFVFASACKENIEDNLTQYGALNNQVTTITPQGDPDSGLVALTYSKGVNNNRTISLGSSNVTIDFGDVDVYLKAVFLTDANTGYVLAYCILTRTIPITNEVVFPASGLVWNIRNEV